VANESEQTTISRQAVESLAEKLESFTGTLSYEEQEALGLLLARADAADPEKPLGTTPPISPERLVQTVVGESGQLARGSEISVTWKHSFAA
jgi:hypothetical protein